VLDTSGLYGYNLHVSEGYLNEALKELLGIASRYSSAVEQLFRKQQAIGSNPITGSCLFFR
jgi:hypothetical protein